VSATALEKTRFRRRLGGSEASMPDSYIDDDVFAEAEAEYSGYSRDVIFKAALLRGVQDLMMSASADVDYREGAASESLSQRFKALKDMEARFQKALDMAIADESQWSDWLPFDKTPTWRDTPDD
jgi:hypothetical protein